MSGVTFTATQAATTNASSTTSSTAAGTATPLPTAPFSLTGVPAPLPSSGSFSGPLAGGLFLAVLAVATLVMARRRRRTTRLVEILETASLGPKRAIVVARLGDELLVLGSSEGGIALLSTRPATSLAARSAQFSPDAAGLLAAMQPAAPPAAAPAADPKAPVAGRVLDLLSRLRPRSRPAPAFDAALTESLEDLELRRKLAGGKPGVIR